MAVQSRVELCMSARDSIFDACWDWQPVKADKHIRDVVNGSGVVHQHSAPTVGGLLDKPEGRRVRRVCSPSVHLTVKDWNVAGGTGRRIRRG